MKNITITLAFIIGFAFSQEFEVDGDLNVTGTIESVTIDSLKQVIESLQSNTSPNSNRNPNMDNNHKSDKAPEWTKDGLFAKLK